ncbi:hypothetical protein IW262DRAFT_1469078 [Armillaria fumosa]|nr:hypothetical protein IW262DRAFT_1469078 [Armillaria fumosa]
MSADAELIYIFRLVIKCVHTMATKSYTLNLYLDRPIFFGNIRFSIHRYHHRSYLTANSASNGTYLKRYSGTRIFIVPVVCSYNRLFKLSSLLYRKNLRNTPQILAEHITYATNNLMLFDIPVASAITFIGLVYLLILSFIVVMIRVSAREVSGLQDKLTTGSQLLKLHEEPEPIGVPKFWTDILFSKQNRPFLRTLVIDNPKHSGLEKTQNSTLGVRNTTTKRGRLFGM